MTVSMLPSCRSSYSRLYTSLTAFRVLAGDASKNSIFASLDAVSFKYSLGVDTGAV
jgi:hypothetical protein